jgi:hypothetical protein
MATVRRGKAIAAPALLLTLAVGCSTSAAIERRDGPTIVGRIDRSDENRLYVSTSEDERFAIDHPGKIGMVIGGITGGIGLGFLALSQLLPDNCAGHTGPGPCWEQRGISAFFGVAHLLVGLPVLLGNLAVSNRSRSAAAPPRPLEPPPGKWQSP